MQRDNISSIVQLLLIKIEFGPIASFIPIALHLFSDNIMFGLEKAKFDISSIVSFCIISELLLAKTVESGIPALITFSASSFPLHFAKPW